MSIIHLYLEYLYHAKRSWRSGDKMAKKPENTNIFELLLQDSEEKDNEKKKEKAELLKSLGVNEYFAEGSLDIDMKTCKGIECNLCVKTCPTNALYWKAGEIGITEDLCVYCAACVFNCIVDNCIRVQRKRSNGEEERFGTPKDVVRLFHNLNSGKRCDRLRSIFPTAVEYLKRYG